MQAEFYMLSHKVIFNHWEEEVTVCLLCRWVGGNQMGGLTGFRSQSSTIEELGFPLWSLDPGTFALDYDLTQSPLHPIPPVLAVQRPCWCRNREWWSSHSCWLVPCPLMSKVGRVGWGICKKDTYAWLELFSRWSAAQRQRSPHPVDIWPEHHYGLSGRRWANHCEHLKC